MNKSFKTVSFKAFTAAFLTAALMAAGCGSNDQNNDVGEQQDVVSDQGGNTDTNQPPDVQNPDEGQPDTTQPLDVQNPDEGQPDTTTAANPHDYWPGVDWDTFFPGPEKSAVYQVTTFDQVQKDLTARVVYDVEWKGGTWTQIVVGDLEPGKDGMAIYFDKSEPWVIKAKGVVVYGENVTDGPLMTEFFTDPIVISLNKDTGDSQEIDTQINGEYDGFVDDMGVTYAIEFTSFDSEVTVPAGTYSGCADLKATLGGELMGGTQTIDVEIKIHPKQTIVHWVDSPGFGLAELKTEWK